MTEYTAYDIIELYFEFRSRDFSEDELTNAKNWIIGIGVK